MKIINGSMLNVMPNGTVFSRIIDNGGIDGSHGIRELNILFNKDKSNYNHFGQIQMLDTIMCDSKMSKLLKDNKDEFCYALYCDCNEFTKDEKFIIWERKEIILLIRNLLWALSGCSNYFRSLP